MRREYMYIINRALRWHAAHRKSKAPAQDADEPRGDRGGHPAQRIMLIQSPRPGKRIENTETKTDRIVNEPANETIIRISQVAPAENLVQDYRLDILTRTCPAPKGA